MNIYKESYRILKKGGIMIIADSNDEFDSFKPFFITRVLRKTISLKNTFLKKKLWKFNSSDEKNYTSEHTHKSITDYINFSMKDNDYCLIKVFKNEHFITQFEGSLMCQSFFDRTLFKILKFLSKNLSINPTSQVLLFFKKD